MTDACRTITLDPRQPMPLELPFKRVSTRAVLVFDVADLVDCAAEGVTVTSALWTPHPSDTGAPTVDAEAVNGLELSARFTGGTEGATYRYSITIQTSAGATEYVWFALPVLPDLPADIAA